MMCNNPAKFHKNRSSVFRGVAFTKLFGRKDGRTSADHYYITPSLRGGGQKGYTGWIYTFRNSRVQTYGWPTLGQAAAVPDNITPQVLKELATHIASILTIIFLCSYQTSEIPDIRKSANICPVYKKGKKYDPINYRPLSLTCVLCFKKFIHSQ